MSDPGPALGVVLDALREALSRPGVRTALGDFGRWLVAISESGAGEPAAKASGPPDVPAPVLHPPEPSLHAPGAPVEDRSTPRAAPIIGPAIPAELKIGDSNRLEVVTRGAGLISTRELAPEPIVPPPPSHPQAEPELPDLRRVAQSARLKAEACARAARGEPAAALRDQVRAVRAGEEAFDAGLWMCSWLDAEGQAKAAQAEPCYRALAAAAELGTLLHERDQLHPGNGLEEPFQRMAQAQSMIRNFVDDSRGDDLDQLDMFHWLRALTSANRCRVLVGRYMRRDDVAPTDDAPAVLAALADAYEAWKARLDGAKERRRLIGKVRHKAGLLGQCADGEAAVIWQDLERVLGGLLELGIRPGDPEVAGALAGVPEAPDGFAPSAGLAEALRRARALSRKQEEPADDGAEPESAPPTPLVAEAAELLRGRVALLIGGEVKPLRRRAIERALGLRELRWIPANMNDSSVGDFEPQLRRPETALVMRMVRFTRTNHGELLDLCKRHGRPFVNLPAGYGVNQLAAEIISQAGAQLRALPPAAPAAAE